MGEIVPKAQQIPESVIFAHYKQMLGDFGVGGVEQKRKRTHGQQCRDCG